MGVEIILIPIIKIFIGFVVGGFLLLFLIKKWYKIFWISFGLVLIFVLVNPIKLTNKRVVLEQSTERISKEMTSELPEKVTREKRNFDSALKKYRDQIKKEQVEIDREIEK